MGGHDQAMKAPWTGATAHTQFAERRECVADHVPADSADLCCNGHDARLPGRQRKATRGGTSYVVCLSQVSPVQFYACMWSMCVNADGSNVGVMHARIKQSTTGAVQLSGHTPALRTTFIWAHGHMSLLPLNNGSHYSHYCAAVHASTRKHE